MGGSRVERGGSSTIPNRTNRPATLSSSPRPLPSGSSQPTQTSERTSPLSVRGGYSPHHPQCSPPAQSQNLETAHGSPPGAHLMSHPLPESAQSVNGGKGHLYINRMYSNDVRIHNSIIWNFLDGCA